MLSPMSSMHPSTGAVPNVPSRYDCRLELGGFVRISDLLCRDVTLVDFDCGEDVRQL